MVQPEQPKMYAGGKVHVTNGRPARRLDTELAQERPCLPLGHRRTVPLRRAKDPPQRPHPTALRADGSVAASVQKKEMLLPCQKFRDALLPSGFRPII